jgi:hypothetical protein
VLKGATPDEVRAIVQDKLEVMRDTPFVVPRLEVQPFTVKPSSEALIQKQGFTLEKVNYALSQAGVKVIDEPLNYKVARLGAYENSTSKKSGVYKADNLIFSDKIAKRTDAEIDAALIKRYGTDAVSVPTSKPVVTTESPIVSVVDLQDAAKGIGTLGEVSQWSVRGDFITPLKEVLNAVDDLGLGVLNTPALPRMVKGGIGKLSNKTVEGVASSLQKVSLETAEDIAKSIFNALWRKATPDQKEIILGKVSATRLEQLGLERVQTKIAPPTTPAPLQYVQAGTLDDATVSAYHVVNDSQVPIEQLRVAMLREQGFDGRTASSMKVHPLSEEIARTGKVSDQSLMDFLNSRELSVSTPTEQKWSSKMLQQIWEVSTPEQKAYIMKNVDNLEQLGLERIARSNVIDDHLPPEGVFDTPC